MKPALTTQTAALRQFALKVMLSIAFWSLFSLISMAQDLVLNPDLEGANCAEFPSPLNCLENTLASIDADLGFYQGLSAAKKAQFKAEYCLQLTFAYSRKDNYQRARHYLRRAEQALNEMTSEESALRQPELKTIYEQYAAYLCEVDSDNSCPETTVESGTEISEMIVTAAAYRPKEAVESVETASAENDLYSDLLEVLRAYIKKNPLSDEFRSASASDSCVLQIRSSVSTKEKTLDCFLAHSAHIDLVGIKMMGIAKDIRYDPAFAENFVAMTILIRPGDKEEVTYSNGKYYVYYPVRTN